MSWSTVVSARLRGLFEHARLERDLKFGSTWRCKLRTTSMRA